jgi:magnesium-transporting ATPase (P-type)
VNTSVIHEDLGLIDYVFSDKTGTLTQNKMVFRYALLAPVVVKESDSGGGGSDGVGVEFEYGSSNTAIGKAADIRQEELARKRAGVDVDAAAAAIKKQPWTVLEAPFRSRGIRAASAAGDKKADKLGACRSMWCHRYFAAERPFSGADTADNDDDDDDKKAKGGNRDDAAAAVAGTTFSAAERDELLKALWTPPAAAAAAAAADGADALDAAALEQRRARLHTYMTHMALSNTVKPFEEGGELFFQVRLRARFNAHTSTTYACSNLPIHSHFFVVFNYIDLPYQASSAEEMAMVSFARDCGFTKRQVGSTASRSLLSIIACLCLCHQTLTIVLIFCLFSFPFQESPTVLEIDEYDLNLRRTGKVTTHKYRLLATLGFTPRRARVTVIYEHVKTRRIHVMTKGQDSVVVPLLKDLRSARALRATMMELSGEFYVEFSVFL